MNDRTNAWRVSSRPSEEIRPVSAGVRGSAGGHRRSRGLGQRGGLGVRPQEVSKGRPSSRRRVSVFVVVAVDSPVDSL